MRVVVLGPPGSGKSTVAKIIGKIYGLPVITSSVLLRKLADKNTDRGSLVQSLMRKGELVPDEIVNRVLKERLQKPDTEDGFVLDGYPRNMAQVEALSSFLEKKGKEFNYVLHVKVANKKLVDRLRKRHVCSNCGATYHLDHNPPEEPRICDRCGFEQVKERMINLKLYSED